jgi:NDP-mannose synthase
MRAIILAGGKGRRLLPYTHFIPKPLVPIGDKYTILEIIIKQLARDGFKHITLTVNHLSHLIRSYFGNGERYNILIDYSEETKELSTIGPLTLIQDLPQDFLVMNGDILTDINYSELMNYHKENKSSVTVAVNKRNVCLDFGIIEYDDSKKLNGFKEKPTLSYDVSMGVYCLKKQAVDGLNVNEFYGFDNLMYDSLQRNNDVSIYPHDGFWKDIGRHEDYEEANKSYKEIYEMLNV